jgi:hypothetical protein
VNIYVASSWKNKFYPEVIATLKEARPQDKFYDFRNPEGGTGFSWAEIDEDWENWNTEKYFAALETKRSKEGFASDMNALKACDLCILVLPCGRSAHLELGYAVGAGKRTIIYMPEYDVPDLMYMMVDAIVQGKEELLSAITACSRKRRIN